MTISIIGAHEVSEYRSAERLSALISQGWPDIADDQRDQVTIVVAAKCFGCAVQDIDLLVIGNFARPRMLPDFDGFSGKQVLSFVWTIEVKGHPGYQITFLGGKVFVPYGRFTKDASEQAFKQKNSLRDFVKRNINRDPHCTELIWLDNCSKNDLPHECVNVVVGDSDWNDFLVAASRMSRDWLKRPGNDLLRAFQGCTVQQQPLITKEVSELFAKSQTASPMDRKRVERVSSRVIEDQGYAKRMGEQLLIFRGRGGTGKTITLIRLALDLHQNQLKRVLLLTYNVALVADMKRTLAIIGAPRDADGPVIQVRTVHSFMLELMKQSGLISCIDAKALKDYDGRLSELDLLLEAFTGADAPAFDFAFIDEAQDWPAAERNIVFKLFTAKRVVVADGVDQLVRSRVSTDWTAKIGNTQKQVVPLRKSLRLKNVLASFANLLASQLGLSDWRLQENPELSGGRVTIVLGSLRAVSQPIEALIKQFESEGNFPVDSLLCVPYTSRASSATRGLATIISNCGQELWDGTDEEDRRSFATSLQQARMVTYESCRGLEGWCVLCYQLDKLYDQKYSDADEPTDLLSSPEEAARQYAASWIMIPMTRAIDHLILHLEDPNHPLAKAIRQTIKQLGPDSEVSVLTPT